MVNGIGVGCACEAMHSKRAQYNTSQTRRGEGKRKGLIGAGEVGCGLVKTPCSESFGKIDFTCRNQDQTRQLRLLLSYGYGAGLIG